MKTLKNPTDNKVSMQYMGVTYEIEPQAMVKLPDDVAEYWVINIHKFLQVLENGQPVVEAIATTPIVEELKEPVKPIKKAK